MFQDFHLYIELAEPVEREATMDGDGGRERRRKIEKIWMEPVNIALAHQKWTIAFVRETPTKTSTADAMDEHSAELLVKDNNDQDGHKVNAFLTEKTNSDSDSK